MDPAGRSPPPGAAVLAAAVEHILLSYLYLDDGNLDGYASLLDENVEVSWPGLPRAHGRATVVATLAKAAGPPGGHRLYRAVGHGDCVVTQGRCSTPAVLSVTGDHRQLDFVDVCTVTSSGLMLGQRRYYDPPEL